MKIIDSQTFTEAIYHAQNLIYQPAFRRSATVAVSAGFTIVELLIVIVVIGVLASLVLVAFNGVTGRANEAHKLADVDTVKKFLEQYYVLNGHYVRNDYFVNGNANSALTSGPLVGLPPEALRGPKASSTTVSSWGQFSGNVSDDSREYAIKTYRSDNTDCNNSSCSEAEVARYVIYYKDNGGTVRSQRSLSGW